MILDPRHYVLDHFGRNWGPLLAPWRDLLPDQFNIFMVNRFGDVVLITPDGSVHILDLGADVMPRIAADLAEFWRLLPDYAPNWLLVPLADECVAAGMSLGQDECYSWRRPPYLGGKYELDNVEIVPVETHYATLGETHGRVQNLSDGMPFPTEP